MKRKKKKKNEKNQYCLKMPYLSVVFGFSGHHPPLCPNCRWIATCILTISLLWT